MLRFAVGCLIAAIATVTVLAVVLVVVALFSLGNVDSELCDQYDIALARHQRIVDLHASWDRSEAGGWLTAEETIDRKLAQPIPDIDSVLDRCA